MAGRDVRKALRGLAQELPAKGRSDPGGTEEWKTIPEQLHHLIPGKTAPGSPPTLGLSRRTRRFYRKSLRHLLDGRRRRHLSDFNSDQKLEEDLWTFCCEIALQDRFRNPEARKQKVEAFINATEIPCEDFEAIVQVTGITIPDPITLGDIELIRGSPTLLKEWGVWSRPHRPKWRGQTFARFKVKGGNVKAASRFARDRVTLVCDELRIALTTSVYARIHDADMAFDTGWGVVRGDGVRSYLPGLRDRKPIQWHGDPLRSAIDYLTTLYDLRATDRPNLQERVDLAIQWFGIARSVGAPLPMKLIAVFSGFESILVKGESERLKGAVLSIRAALLSIAVNGYFSDPGEILALYRLRSELVHGARTTADERDFGRTLGTASEALRNYIAIANRNTDIRNHKRLLASLSGEQTLDDLRQWITDYGPWGERELLKAIDQLI